METVNNSHCSGAENQVPAMFKEVYQHYFHSLAVLRDRSDLHEASPEFFKMVEQEVKRSSLHGAA